MSTPTPEHGGSLRSANAPYIARVSPITRHRSARKLKGRNLTLVSAGAVIPLGLAVDSPTLMMVAVEDCCWRFALDELGPRPAVWQRAARAVWDGRRAQLEARRERIATMADDAVSAL